MSTPTLHRTYDMYLRKCKYRKRYFIEQVGTLASDESLTAH
jgi:hypothetical protein